MKIYFVSLLLLVTSACGPAETDLATAFCDVLGEAPARTVTATESADNAPDVTDSGRVDIEPNAGAESGGFVSYLPDEAGSFAFGLTEDVSITVRDDAGNVVALESTVVGSTVCDELAVRYSVPLEIEAYTIELGASNAALIGIVAEESNDDL